MLYLIIDVKEGVFSYGTKCYEVDVSIEFQTIWEKKHVLQYCNVSSVNFIWNINFENRYIRISSFYYNFEIVCWLNAKMIFQFQISIIYQLLKSCHLALLCNTIYISSKIYLNTNVCNRVPFMNLCLRVNNLVFNVVNIRMIRLSILIVPSTKL